MQLRQLTVSLFCLLLFNVWFFLYKNKCVRETWIIKKSFFLCVEKKEYRSQKASINTAWSVFNVPIYFDISIWMQKTRSNIKWNDPCHEATAENYPNAVIERRTSIWIHNNILILAFSSTYCSGCNQILYIGFEKTQ